MNQNIQQQSATDFETVGYYEELVETEAPHKCLGTRRLDSKPERELGHAGRTELTFTEPFMVNRGHKTVRVPASKKKPVKVWSMAQRLCGRAVAK